MSGHHADRSLTTTRLSFLDGVRVLEIGDGVAGASAGSILWLLGADVTTVVDPNAAHRRGRPSVTTNAGLASLLSCSLDRGKRIVRYHHHDLADLLSSDVGEVDLVIADRVLGAGGPLDALADVDTYRRVVEQTCRAAWVTISAFGLTGPRASEFATELTLAAASGMLATIRDPETRQPLKLAGHQCLLNAGQAAALAACQAVELARDGAPVHLDLSVQEATIATGPVLEVGGLSLETGARGGARRYGAPAGFFECRDGVARISAMEDHQWQGVVRSMGSPEWASAFDAVSARIESADVIDEHVGAWCRQRSKREVETVMQANGVPATAVYTPQEILESPQLAHRRALQPLDLSPELRATVVGLPASHKPDGSAPARRSIRGLQVLEASRVLAVPLSGALLGALGATVTKLEDLPRLDMYRRRGPYIDGEEGADRSAYFTLFNHSKASAAFDVDADPERLESLAEAADVVLENLGPKRSSAIGLDAASMATKYPGRLVVSSSGFGLEGPHSRYRAYAYNLQASCALGYLTRTDRGDPAEIDLAWADLISGYALATLVAAWAVGPNGNGGAALDFSMAELIVAHFNEFIAAASIGVDIDTDTDRANQQAPYAPSGVYPTADGWVAISVADDEQFRAMAKVLDDPRFTVEEFETAPQRLSATSSLDALVGDATRGHDAPSLVTALRAVDVPAEPVADAAALLADGHLATRGFFTEITHPEWGTRKIVGIPWRQCGAPPIPLGPPPRFTPMESSP